MATESPQQKAVLEWLAVNGILAYRMQTGALKMEGRLIRFGVMGMADIVAFPHFKGERYPRVLWIEMKSSTGRQSKLQKSFADQVREAGLFYVVARCIDDVENYLTEMSKL